MLMLQIKCYFTCELSLQVLICSNFSLKSANSAIPLVQMRCVYSPIVTLAQSFTPSLLPLLQVGRYLWLRCRVAHLTHDLTVRYQLRRSLLHKEQQKATQVSYHTSAVGARNFLRLITRKFNFEACEDKVSS